MRTNCPGPERLMRSVVVRLDGLLWRLSVDGVPHSAHLHEEQALQRASDLAREVGAAVLVRTARIDAHRAYRDSRVSA